jgi:hypothetical protein
MGYHGLQYIYNFILFQMIKLLMAATAVSMLSACAAPPARYDWVKTGATGADKINSLSECKYQIKLNKTDGDKQADLAKLCMQGKGYRWVRVS